MTSRKSFCNFNMLLETLKQSKYLMILHTVVLFLCTSLPTVMINSSERRTDIYNDSYLFESCRKLLSGFSPAVTFCAVIAATVTAIFVFGYLFSRQPVQFYNSMPISRGCMFVSKFSAAFVSLAIPVLLIFIANSVLYLLIDITRNYYCGDMLFGLGIMLLSYLAALSVAAFAATLAGNFFSLVITEGLVYLIYPLIAICVSFSFDTWFERLSVDINCNAVYICPPALLFCRFTNLEFKPIYCVYSVLYSIVFFALGLWLYRMRKSENTEKFFAYKAVGKFIKYYVTSAASLLFGALFLEMSDNNTIVGYIGYILIAFISFITLQAIFEKNLRSMFANMKSLAVFAVILAAVVAVPMAFHDKIDSFIPDSDKISRLDAEVYYGGYDSYRLEFAERENINSVVELYKKSLNSDSDSDSPRFSEHMTVTLYTCVDNPFIEVRRRARGALEYADYEEYFSSIFDTAEYKEQMTKRIDISIDSAKYFHLMKYKLSYYPSDDLNEIKKLNRLREIFRDDFLKYPFEQIKDSGVYANFEINGVCFKIYNCYSESVAYFKKTFGGREHKPDDVKMITIKRIGETDADNTVLLETDEPEKISIIIEKNSASMIGKDDLQLEMWTNDGEYYDYAIDYNLLTPDVKALLDYN